LVYGTGIAGDSAPSMAQGVATSIAVSRVTPKVWICIFAFGEREGYWFNCEELKQLNKNCSLFSGAHLFLQFSPHIAGRERTRSAKRGGCKKNGYGIL
jgi:hypothetical protein